MSALFRLSITIYCDFFGANTTPTGPESPPVLALKQGNGAPRAAIQGTPRAEAEKVKKLSDMSTIKGSRDEPR